MKKKPQTKSARQCARELAVQALYHWQLSSTSSDKLIQEFIDSHDLKKVDKKYWRELVSECIKQKGTLQENMQPFLSRNIEQITPVELAILSVAFYEFLSRPDVPFRVVINEAIDLAKCFGASDSHRFINGVLDAAAKKLRATEQAIKK